VVVDVVAIDVAGHGARRQHGERAVEHPRSRGALGRRARVTAAAVLAVHVMPSGLVITRLVPLSATATNRLFPNVTERQLFCSAAVLAVGKPTVVLIFAGQAIGL
jgi:hypothetical protein